MKSVRSLRLFAPGPFLSLVFLVAAANSDLFDSACQASESTQTNATSQADESKGAPVQIRRETRDVLGWSLHIDQELLQKEAKATQQAVSLLKRQLAEIVRVVPAPMVAELQKVALYFSPSYPGVQPGAEFHPGAEWLKENGRDPVMVKSVEFTNIPDFEAETIRMPNFALHELAHAYHFRVLPDGYGNAEVIKAFETAKASGKYDRVERSNGVRRQNSFEKAYGMSSPMEYFAESTEAYFSKNDFFPFNSKELKSHDPEMFDLLTELWGVKSNASATKNASGGSP